jgi:plasmid maintenance system antidote protein VapI
MINSGQPPIHPCEFLIETLTELGISHAVKGTRPVTAELAWLLGHALGQSPQYRLNLQTA